MKEDLLHYLWQYQDFNKDQLTTLQHEAVQILSVGTHNLNAGPDFLNARIKLDGILWSGAVEIHIHSSDWYRHKHDSDGAYDKVILHVVWEDDQPAYRSDGTRIPTLTLKSRIKPEVAFRYQRFFQEGYQQGKGILCQHQLSTQNTWTILSALEHALVQRMETKAGDVLALLESNKGDWQETMYQSLAKGFGFKINAVPLLALSKAVPLSVIAKIAHRPEALEAAFLGQAGFLEEACQDEYTVRLAEEYLYLAKKFNWQQPSLQSHQWKFSRLRPANFPTLRIAQFAEVVRRYAHEFSRWIEVPDGSEIARKLAVQPSAYWQQHYQLGSLAAVKLNGLGKQSIDHLMINVWVPVKFAYARYFRKEAMAEQALNFLEKLPAEKNRITRQYQSLDFPLNSAFDSQAVIELHNNYCQQHRCLRCKIGVSIMKNMTSDDRLSLSNQ